MKEYIASERSTIELQSMVVFTYKEVQLSYKVWHYLQTTEWGDLSMKQIQGTLRNKHRNNHVIH